MNRGNNFILFLGSEKIELPTDSRFLKVINHYISNIINEKGEYIVESNVSEDIFKRFVRYILNKEELDFNENNILEYSKLSEEFDIIKDLISIYKKKTSTTIFPLQLQNENLQKSIESSKNKLKEKEQTYQKTIQILFKNNAINSYQEYINIKDSLQDACEEEKIKFVDLITRKKIEQSNITYVLNEKEKTAGVYKVNDIYDSIFIPKSIKYHSCEYFVTTIYEKSFENCKKIKTIHFPDDFNSDLNDKNESVQSKLQSIDFSSFKKSSIESITIPSSVIEIKEGWCRDASELIEFTIMPNNRNYINYENMFILGKSQPKSETYDVLLFAKRNIQIAIIPHFVKKIAKYAFADCMSLKHIYFKDNSELENIDDYAFYHSKIKNIKIPSHVTRIGKNAFLKCRMLFDIEFDENSELKTIEKYAFYETKLSSLIIPKSVVDFNGQAFDSSLHYFKIVLHPENTHYFNFEDKFILSKTHPKKDIFNVLHYANNVIQMAIIPSSIEEISPYAFANCQDMNTIKFSENSKLRTIGKFAFSCTTIESICIPSSVVEIGKGTFAFCPKLKNIIFPNDSKVRILRKKIFYNSNIENFTIPPSIVKLEEGWCQRACELKMVSIMNGNSLFFNYENNFILGKSNLKKDIFDILHFARRNIRIAVIPYFIKEIGKYAFESCKALKTINFSKNSQLKIINESAFYEM